MNYWFFILQQIDWLICRQHCCNLWRRVARLKVTATLLSDFVTFYERISSTVVKYTLTLLVSKKLLLNQRHLSSQNLFHPIVKDLLLHLKWSLLVHNSSSTYITCLFDKNLHKCSAILYYVVYSIWQYRLWSFQRRDTNLERFLTKNQLYWNYQIWRIGVVASCQKVPKVDFQSQFSM